MKPNTKSTYAKIHASMVWKIKKLPVPTAPLKGNGHDRNLFIKGRRDCTLRFLEASPAKIMFLEELPDEHRALVHIGLFDIDAFISPQAKACWKANAKHWRRLASWRIYTKPTM